MTPTSYRPVLAWIAAKGILGHNTAVEMPQRFTAARIQEAHPDATIDVLDQMVDMGVLARWNTGHSGYGDSYISGPDVYYVTEAGLMDLWL